MSVENRPSAFLFDIGNVVVYSSHAVTRAWLARYHKISPDKSNKFFAVPEYLQFARGAIGPEEFHNGIRRDVDESLTIHETRRAHDEHIFGIFQETVAVIGELAKQGDRIAFVTDTNIWQTERVNQLVDLGVFSKEMHESCNIGMIKVDPGFFPYLVDQLKMDPADALLIDDSPEKIEMAQKVGLQTLLFVNPSQLKSELVARKLLNL